MQAYISTLPTQINQVELPLLLILHLCPVTHTRSALVGDYNCVSVSDLRYQVSLVMMAVTWPSGESANGASSMYFIDILLVHVVWCNKACPPRLQRSRSWGELHDAILGWNNIMDDLLPNLVNTGRHGFSLLWGLFSASSVGGKIFI